MSAGHDSLPNLITDTDAAYLEPNAQFQGCPVRPRMARSNYGVELLSRDLVRGAFIDRRMTPRSVEYYEARGASPIILEFIREGNLNFMPPEKHDRIRVIFEKAFTRTHVDSLRPVMRELTRTILLPFMARGECDLVADLCHFYPISVIAQFIGVPADDVPKFAGATVQLRMLGQVPFAPGIPVLESALTFMKDYMLRLIAERRAAPGDGFLDDMVALKSAGEQLSEEELVWGLVFLLFGGHDTTRFTLAGCFHSLITCGLWEKVAASPKIIPEMIIESMRYRTGTPRQMRIVAEPLKLDGHSFEVGDVISLNLSVAGRDPEAYETPDEFRCAREPVHSIGFGVGRHICLGIQLAKAEMEEAIAVATAIMTSVEIAGACAIKPTGVIAGLDSLPVRFKQRN